MVIHQAEEPRPPSKEMIEAIDEHLGSVRGRKVGSSSAISRSIIEKGVFNAFDHCCNLL